MKIVFFQVELKLQYDFPALRPQSVLLVPSLPPSAEQVHTPTPVTHLVKLSDEVCGIMLLSWLGRECSKCASILPV